MQASNTKNVVSVLGRLKQALGIDTETALAEYLNIAPSTLSSWKSRDTLDYPLIIEKSGIEGLNIHWLLTGDGEMYLQAQMQAHLQAQSKETVKKNDPVQPQVITVDGTGKENIVFVDAKAAAGYATNLTDQVFFQKLPSFNLPTRMFQNASFRAFQIDGDSMEDTLKRGDWVFGKYLENGAADCKNGYTYVIVTYEGIVFKRVLNRVKERGTLVLQSDNPTYRPYEVDVRDIQEVWDIKSAMMFDLSNRRLDLLKRVNELEAEMVAVHSDIKLIKAKL